MKVHLENGKSYFVEKRLAAVLDLMVKRIQGTDDALLLIDGDEGQGKSNMAAGIGGYIHIKTGRPLSLDNLFFDLDELIKKAISSENQILIWDEGALGGLASEWWRKNQLKFIKFLMVARKKKHFIIICIPKFFKLNEYLVVDRSVGMINVYSRHNIQKGRFRYYKKKNKEYLYDFWKRSRKRTYGKFMSFGGWFPIALPKVFDEKEYDKRKDAAILSIDEEKTNIWKDKFIGFRKLVGEFIVEHKLTVPAAKKFGVHRTSFNKWTKKKRRESNVSTL